MAQKIPMTKVGYDRLRAEVERLKREERPRVIRAIEEARAHGDLSENAEYHAAREQQSFLEGRINEIEAKLAAAEVIDPATLNGERITFGSTVRLRQADGKELRYQIVGSDEAAPNQGLISVLSPLARTLIGKYEGEVVRVQTPGGVRQVEIIAVNFSSGA